MQLKAALRWTARIWSIASSLLILAFVTGGRESLWPTANEAVGLLFFPIGVMVGFVIAWWHESTGGLITLTSLALFYFWMFSRDGRLPTGPYFLLLAAPGFLYVTTALIGRTRRSGSKNL